MDKLNIENLEARYAGLTFKSRFARLEVDEEMELEVVSKLLELETCTECKGEGVIVNPSIIGYGTEEGDCKVCRGTGKTNMSESLYEQLDK